jgi:hypothetical protein
MVGNRELVADLQITFRNEYQAFWTSSNEEGWAGYELCLNRGEMNECVCRIIYWDAVGQYFLELPKGELKIEYVLKLLAETVKRVKAPVFDCEKFFCI